MKGSYGRYHFQLLLRDTSLRDNNYVPLKFDLKYDKILNTKHKWMLIWSCFVSNLVLLLLPFSDNNFIESSHPVYRSKGRDYLVAYIAYIANIEDQRKNV